MKIGRANKKRTKKFGIKLELSKVNWDKVGKIFASDIKFLKKRLEKQEEVKSSSKELLLLLAGGGIFALSLVFPTLPMALAPFIIDRNKYKQGLFNRNIKRLKKQKLVEIVYEGEQTLVKITNEGRVRALRYKLSEIQVKKPKVWDGKWRIVIFDIPEKHKRMREIFRNHLKLMGFYMLQKSVWVHPYPCGSEIEFLRQVYKVGVDVTYILAERIENANNLKEHFHL